MMKSLAKTVTGAGLVVALFMVCGGKSVRDAFGYLRACTETTIGNVAESVPWPVLVKKLEAELAEFESKVVEQQVQLDLSSQQIERRRTDLGQLVSRAERVERLLVICHAVLDDAIHGQRATVSFSGSEMPLTEFQSAIDDLIAQRESSTSELTAIREELELLEKEHAQAKAAVAEAQRALRAAKSEARLLMSQHEHAEIEDSTVRVIMATSDNLKVPQESMSEGLGRMRDRVARLKARNRVLWATASGDMAGRKLLAGLSRIDALKEIHNAAPLEKSRPTQPAASQTRADHVNGVTDAATSRNDD